MLLAPRMYRENCLVPIGKHRSSLAVQKQSFRRRIQTLFPETVLYCLALLAQANQQECQILKKLFCPKNPAVVPIRQRTWGSLARA